MSSNSTGTDVFEDVDPDPDAVLAEFGVESPDDLLEADGAHDPVADERVRDEGRSGDGGLEFAGDPDGTITVHSESSNETELVGPDPTPTRITNDVFRSVDADMR
ncbi:hypothetical protein [Natronorubrum halophilum]|uniref:hypothetical protein n=1 Tax=Natronorubrum halophilum TaxID=1702106 RepID=UPI000EF6A437|nr:hypothetical protein [Natronorubrum halophilum]